MSTKQELARNLKFARIKAGLSSTTAAERIGVTRQTLSNWEREDGGYLPDEDNLARAAEVYGTTRAALRYRSGRDEEFTSGPRVAKGLPLAVREFIQEELLAYTRAGVTEDELEHARNLFQSPEAFAFFKGGVRGEFNEENLMKDLRAYAKFLRTVFKERGYKPL